MGCDIHLCVEKKVDGQWIAVKGPDIWEPERESLFWLTNARSYRLFAILADVRNDRDVDGCDTEKNFNPIAGPKSLPADISPEILAESDSWDGDGHSHSYHTVQDLLAYDWTQMATLQGWLSISEYWKWSRYNKRHGEGPEDYCGSVGGGMTKHISEEEMESIVKPIRDSGKTSYADQEATLNAIIPHYYTLCTWKQPYYKTCRYFLSDCIPQLLRLGKPEDVRIVFWFDN